MARSETLILLAIVSASLLFASSSHAATTTVDVSQVLGWRVMGFTSSDVTYPASVSFVFRLKNNGTLDFNATGNLSITKGGTQVHSSQNAISGNITQQRDRNFSFGWTPTSSGDFIANLTFDVSNQATGQSGSGSSLTAFTVYAEPSGSSGGTDTSVTIVTGTGVTVTVEEILPGSPAEVEIGREIFSITSIEIDVTQSASGVTVTVDVSDDRPSSAGSDAPGEVYQYIEVGHQNVEDRIKSVFMKFRVAKSWLDENNVSKSSVRLNRYENGEWVPYSATIYMEADEYVHYISEVPGLSVFSITGEKKTCDPGERRCEGDELQECNSSGTWKTLKICGAGCDSVSSECVKEKVCSPGEMTCMGNKVIECTEDGYSWGVIESCRYGCSSGHCLGAVTPLSSLIAFYSMMALLAVLILVIIYAGFGIRK